MHHVHRQGVLSTILIVMAGCQTEGADDIVPGKPRVGDRRFISAVPLDHHPLVDDLNPEARQEAEDHEIEAADIIRADGDLLYLLNAYRGLEIIDLSDPDAPIILGNARVFGYPVEMHIDGHHAYVVVSNYFSFWPSAEGADQWRGSRIVVIDIGNPALPRVTSTVHIEGFISETLRLGDILYLASTRSAWWTCPASADNADLTFVASLNISDPDNIFQVERIDFPGANTQTHATENAIFVAQYRHDWDNQTVGWGYGSTVTYLDISDPVGDIVERGGFLVPGYLCDRHAMDWHDDTFRVVTCFWESAGHLELHTFDTGDPSHIVQQGSLRIEDAGRLVATRFAGDRAYTIHSPQTVDTLEVIDLSDPQNPQLKATLQIPGWVDFEVRGHRIIALGADDTTSPRRVSLKLFDVTDANAPMLLNEAPIDEGESWSQEGWVPKGLDILDDRGLILVPYASWTGDAGDYGCGVALFSWLDNNLDGRGVLPTLGHVNQIRVWGNRILVLSPSLLEVFDANDLDNPSPTASLELAWNVADLVTVGDHSVQLVGDYWTYWGQEPTRELRIVPLSQPDTGPVAARVELDAPYGRLFVNGSLIYVASHDWEAETTSVQVFDLTNPLAPLPRGRIEMDVPGGFDYWGGLYGFWGAHYHGGEVFRLGDHLVFHPSGWFARDALADAAAPELDEIWIVSLDNPDVPTAVRVPLPHLATQVSGRDSIIYYTYTESAEVKDSPFPWAAYYLGRITLSAAGSPTTLSRANIPGQFIDASSTGSVIYTLNYAWTDDGILEKNFNTLRLHPTFAELLDDHSLKAGNTWIDGLQVQDGIAHVVEQVGGGVSCDEPPRFTLTLLDVHQPKAVTTAGQFSTTGYGLLLAIEKGRAFLNMGWGNGLVVLNITDPTTPTLMSSFGTQGFPVAIRIENDVALLPSGYYGVQMFRLSDAAPLL